MGEEREKHCLMEERERDDSEREGGKGQRQEKKGGDEKEGTEEDVRQRKKGRRLETFVSQYKRQSLLMKKGVSECQ
jgi:hypothetical protein